VAAGHAMAGVAIGGPVGAVAGYFIGDSLKRALESDVVKKPKNESFVTAGGKNTEG
jgi:gas vesicle protein